MDSNKDSTLAVGIIPAAITAVFQSKAWREFVRRADGHAEVEADETLSANNGNINGFLTTLR